jgi:ubiquinone/menaquinone biosynthesis C-methylase UbiE
MVLPAWFDDIIRCPETGNILTRRGNDYVREDGKAYSFQDGILSIMYPELLSGHDEEWNRIYEWLAPFYDFSERFLGRLITGLDIMEGRKEIVTHLDLYPGLRLLEVSPGPGVFQKLLRDNIGKNGQLVSLDLSKNMLRQCKRQKDTNAILVHANGQYLPFAENSFDALFHFGGINLFNEPERAIQEFMRVVKKGGMVSWGDEGFSGDYKDGWRKSVLTRMNPGYLKNRPAIPGSLTDVKTFTVYGGLGYLVVGKKA